MFEQSHQMEITKVCLLKEYAKTIFTTPINESALFLFIFVKTDFVKKYPKTYFLPLSDLNFGQQTFNITQFPWYVEFQHH